MQRPTGLVGLFARRAPAVLRAGYSTASGDVGAKARITWIEGYVKAVVYAAFFNSATAKSSSSLTDSMLHYGFFEFQLES
jgi:hypothetical protein